jgi:hypothetical protein
MLFKISAEEKIPGELCNGIRNSLLIKSSAILNEMETSWCVVQERHCLNMTLRLTFQ